MQIGTLYKYDEKTYEKEIRDGKALGIGVSPQSILDDLNSLEVKHKYDTPAVLGEFKFDLLVLLGKIILPEPKPGAEEKPQNDVVVNPE